MPDIAVQVADRELAQIVRELVARARLSASSTVTSDVDLLVTDHTPPAGSSLPTVLVARGADAEVWRGAAGTGVEQVVVLPDGAPLLLKRLRSRRPRPPGILIRVIGCRGGCGATTVSVGLAVALSATVPTTLIDADPAGGGLDVAVGVDGERGLRWPELSGLRGMVPVGSLVSRLPRAAEVPILSHGRDVAEMADAWAAVTGSLLSGGGVVVADVPRYQVTSLACPGDGIDILVVPPDVVAIATARRLIAAGHVASRPVLALRRTRGTVPPAVVAEELPGRATVLVPDAAGVRAAADFGDLAEAVTARGFRGACRRLATVAVGGGSDD